MSWSACWGCWWCCALQQLVNSCGGLVHGSGEVVGLLYFAHYVFLRRITTGGDFVEYLVVQFWKHGQLTFDCLSASFWASSPVYESINVSAFPICFLVTVRCPFLFFLRSAVLSDIYFYSVHHSLTQLTTCWLEGLRVAALPFVGLKDSALLVSQRSDTRTVCFHILSFVLDLDRFNSNALSIYKYIYSG